MEYLLIALIPGAFVLNYTFYKMKLRDMKKQLIISNKQFTRLRKNFNELKDNPNISVKFFTPLNKGGITKNNTNMHIAPVETSVILEKLTMKTEVQILDRASVENTYWFYVQIPCENNINCRGWIKEKDFTMLYNHSNKLKNPF